jgi:hypothetical protein
VREGFGGTVNQSHPGGFGSCWLQVAHVAISAIVGPG